MSEIINTYDQLKAAVEAGLLPKTQAVAVSYCARPAGRMGICRCNKTLVFSPFFKTDVASHWSDHGNKSFIGNRSESFEAAKAWASATYGITEWKPNAWRDHVPAIAQKYFPIRKQPCTTES